MPNQAKTIWRGNFSHGARSGRHSAKSQPNKRPSKPFEPRTTEGMYLGREIPKPTRVTVIPDQTKLTYPSLVRARNEQHARELAARFQSYHVVRHQSRWYCDSTPATVERDGRKAIAPKHRTPEQLQAIETARYFANANDDARKWLSRENRYKVIAKIPNAQPTRDSIDRYLYPNRNK